MAENMSSCWNIFNPNKQDASELLAVTLSVVYQATASNKKNTFMLSAPFKGSLLCMEQLGSWEHTLLGQQTLELVHHITRYVIYCYFIHIESAGRSA